MSHWQFFAKQVTMCVEPHNVKEKATGRFLNPKKFKNLFLICIVKKMWIYEKHQARIFPYINPKSTHKCTRCHYSYTTAKSTNKQNDKQLSVSSILSGLQQQQHKWGKATQFCLPIITLPQRTQSASSWHNWTKSCPLYQTKHLCCGVLVYNRIQPKCPHTKIFKNNNSETKEKCELF